MMDAALAGAFVRGAGETDAMACLESGTIAGVVVVCGAVGVGRGRMTSAFGCGAGCAVACCVVCAGSVVGFADGVRGCSVGTVGV